jgi:hypothetical protein
MKNRNVRDFLPRNSEWTGQTHSCIIFFMRKSDYEIRMSLNKV